MNNWEILQNAGAVDTEIDQDEDGTSYLIVTADGLHLKLYRDVAIIEQEIGDAEHRVTLHEPTVSVGENIVLTTPQTEYVIA